MVGQKFDREPSIGAALTDASRTLERSQQRLCFGVSDHVGIIVPSDHWRNISITLTVVLERYLITSAADPRRSRSDLASFAAPDSWPDPDTISRRFRPQLGGRLIALCDAY